MLKNKQKDGNMRPGHMMRLDKDLIELAAKHNRMIGNHGRKNIATYTESQKMCTVSRMFKMMFRRCANWFGSRLAKNRILTLSLSIVYI